MCFCLQGNFSNQINYSFITYVHMLHGNSYMKFFYIPTSLVNFLNFDLQLFKFISIIDIEKDKMQCLSGMFHIKCLTQISQDHTLLNILSSQLIILVLVSVSAVK